MQNLLRQLLLFLTVGNYNSPGDTVVVKIKFRFSIRTTAVERVNRCRIEPVLPQNRDSKTTVARLCYGTVSNEIAVLRLLVTPYNG